MLSVSNWNECILLHAAGNNPIMLIGTKVDLLPAGTNPAEVAEWLRAFAAFKRISAVSVHLVSGCGDLRNQVWCSSLRRWNGSNVVTP